LSEGRMDREQMQDSKKKHPKHRLETAIHAIFPQTGLHCGSSGLIKG
jgi:hypothetical protein